MIKKLFLGFFTSLVLLIILYCFFFLDLKNPSFDECPFCDKTILNYQKFYEDDSIVAIYSHKPITEGHCLIIPKRHIKRFEELSTEEISKMHEAIKKVNIAVQKAFKTNSYVIMQKNGKSVGQTVSHVHMHYIPRDANDTSIIKFFINILIANIKKPLSYPSMRYLTNNLKIAIQEN